MSGAEETRNRVPRILVVEDQYAISQFTRVILEKAGYEVAVASDGARAVAAVRDTDVDLVLMDADMPIMDGMAATRAIRALEGRHSQVPIIAFSGDSQSLVAAGVNDHLHKPFRKAELLLKVGAWLGIDAAVAPVCRPDKPAASAFEEARDLMGSSWALRGLTDLNALIDETFGTGSAPPRSGEPLVTQAHALVSLGAVLGFANLSESCSALEEACRSSRAVQAPFEHAKVVASEVRTAAIGLISSLQIEAGTRLLPIPRNDAGGEGL